MSQQTSWSKGQLSSSTSSCGSRRFLSSSGWISSTRLFLILSRCSQHLCCSCYLQISGLLASAVHCLCPVRSLSDYLIAQLCSSKLNRTVPYVYSKVGPREEAPLGTVASGCGTSSYCIKHFWWCEGGFGYWWRSRPRIWLDISTVWPSSIWVLYFSNPILWRLRMHFQGSFPYSNPYCHFQWTKWSGLSWSWSRFTSISQRN